MNEPKINWPKYLRAFRAENKLSQAMLSAELGISKRTVEDWESGRNVPIAFLFRALRDIKQSLHSSN